MTDVKMPEPAVKGDAPSCCGSFTTGAEYMGQRETLCCGNFELGAPDLYTESNMKQYGDDRAREALEMAADVVMMYTPRTGHSSPNWIRSLAMIDAIRALAKEIK